MASLYSNENLPLPVVERLRELGHDVLTSHESGRANKTIPGDEVLRFAAESGRAVLTLHRVDSKHCTKQERLLTPGQVTWTVDRNFKALANRIHAELERAGLLDGQLIRVVRG